MSEALALARAPKQLRSRVSFERVLDSALELLISRGSGDFTLQEVSELSGVSIGAIYYRLDSKEELVRAVQARVMARIGQEQAQLLDPARWEGLSLKALIPPLIDSFADFVRANAPILRALMHRALFDPELAKAGKASYQDLVERFSALLLSRRSEIANPEPERAVVACLSIAYAALARELGLGMAPTVVGDADWVALKSDLGRMCRCFLTDPQ